MSTYFLLIALELVLGLCIKLMVPNKAKQEKLIAQLGMFLIFLLLALKKETVGIDIAGYKRQYELAAVMPWTDFDYVYFEKGYLLLTKVFSKIGISFQLFTAVLYALLCHSVSLLIRKFSPNATLSILIFICYNFLVFSISGLRQTLAMAICIYAFLFCVRHTKKTTIIAIVLNTAAVYVHESAIVFFAVLAAVLLMNRKITVSAWVALTAAVFVFRSVIWKVVSYFYDKNITMFSISGTFIFLVGMVSFMGFTYYYYPKKRILLTMESGALFHYDAFLVRAACLSLMCYIMFTGGTLLRSNMFFTLMLIPGIPISTSKYQYQTRFLLNMAMGAFLLWLFYVYILRINMLNMYPYRFFWQ